VLGTTQLYDIGCGQQLQALLLMDAPEMRYTGIDPLIFHDYVDEFIAEPAYINELFEKFTGSGRITYLKDTYPCDLTIVENNIALLLDFGIADEEIKSMAAALSRDFERIVLGLPYRAINLAGMDVRDIVYSEVEVWENPFEKYYDLWKSVMPDFEFYRIGERNCILVTKIREDREKLEKKYTVIGDRILTGAVDVPWHVELLKPIINP
jgi:hypothetical protein